MKEHLVVLTGAGISTESGLKTFRDSNGLWENYHVQDVATPEAWARDPKLVLRFYNERRRQMLAAKPNEAHYSLVQLENNFQVSIITQNVDDLHERAGSQSVLHLHGILTKSRSSVNEKLTYDLQKDIEWGEVCEKGSQLRPHIVWFGESVPLFQRAQEITQKADIFLVVGTSLAVYPAASLLQDVPQNVHRYIVDPNLKIYLENATVIQKKASQGVKELAEKWLLKTNA